MTDREIDKWVEEHLEFRGNWPENSIEKQNIINGILISFDVEPKKRRCKK